MSDHPACGLYRTTRALDGVPAGRLVYFHNHGDPGPGIYLPKDWSLNRARWNTRGYTVSDPQWTASLEPLKAEGLYRVRERFYCCEKKCRAYEPSMLVQLGYTGDAEALLFVPEWTEGGLGFPERGNRVGPEQLGKLEGIAVAQGNVAPSAAGGLVH